MGLEDITNSHQDRTSKEIFEELYNKVVIEDIRDGFVIRRILKPDRLYHHSKQVGAGVSDGNWRLLLNTLAGEHLLRTRRQYDPHVKEDINPDVYGVGRNDKIIKEWLPHYGDLSFLFAKRGDALRYGDALMEDDPKKYVGCEVIAVPLYRKPNNSNNSQ